MALNKQTTTRCQCFCLHQEMPRRISVMGCIEDEVLFSFLPEAKIENVPSLTIFFFCVCGKRWHTARFVNLLEPDHELGLVAAGSWILFHLSSPNVPLFFSLLSYHHWPKHTLVPWDWRVPTVAPSSGKHPSCMKACGETFTMWELLATFKERQPSVV